MSAGNEIYLLWKPQIPNTTKYRAMEKAGATGWMTLWDRLRCMVAWMKEQKNQAWWEGSVSALEHASKLKEALLCLDLQFHPSQPPNRPRTRWVHRFLELEHVWPGMYFNGFTVSFLKIDMGSRFRYFWRFIFYIVVLGFPVLNFAMMKLTQIYLFILLWEFEVLLSWFSNEMWLCMVWNIKTNHMGIISPIQSYKQ